MDMALRGGMGDFDHLPLRLLHRRRHEGAAAGGSRLGQALGDRLGLGTRNIADDGNDGTLRTVVVAVEGDEVFARDGAHAFHRRAETP
jgi:hypothetical protein